MLKAYGNNVLVINQTKLIIFLYLVIYIEIKLIPFTDLEIYHNQIDPIDFFATEFIIFMILNDLKKKIFYA